MMIDITHHYVDVRKLTKCTENGMTIAWVHNAGVSGWGISLGYIAGYLNHANLQFISISLIRANR